MQLLLIAPLNLPWHASRYITAAFQRRGWDVLGFDYRNPFRARKEINVELFDLRKTDFDLILLLKGEAIYPEVLKEFKAPKALWYFDVPILDELLEVGKECDYFFLHINHDEIKRKYKEFGIEITYLPQGVDLQAHYPVIFDETFASTISFLGSYDPYREDILRDLNRQYENLKIWGNNWGGSGLQKIWQGSTAYHKQYRKVCSSARIVLNLGRQNIWKWDISARIFMTAACMGFQISHEVEELREYFEPGKEIIIASKDRPLGQVIRYYLKHPRERKKIVEAAYKRVVAEHTYNNRIGRLLKWMKL